MTINLTKSLFNRDKSRPKFGLIRAKLFSYYLRYHKDEYPNFDVIQLNKILEADKVALFHWCKNVILTGLLWAIALLLVPIFSSNIIFYYKALLSIIPFGVGAYLVKGIIETIKGDTND